MAYSKTYGRVFQEDYVGTVFENIHVFMNTLGRKVWLQNILNAVYRLVKWTIAVENVH